MRLLLSDFTKGLWLLGGKETVMKGFLRRARGVHELRTPSLRSRLGSDQIYTTNNVNSIFRFNNTRYYSTTAGVLYSDGVSIKTGLGGLLRFIRAAPQPGIDDYLFYLDGANAGKVSDTNVVSKWGITAPASNPSAATNGAGALTGVYQYLVTFQNSTTGSRSNPNPVAASVTASGNSLRLTSIPVSADPQVDNREVYRTTANGSRFFKVGNVGDNSTTTYNDNTLDTNLQTFEIQFDNIDPYAALTDAWMTNDQRMWWCGDTRTGNGGLVYYSPPGRAESVRGFITLCTPSEFTTKGVSWNGGNYVFTVSRMFQIFGDDEPFTSRPIDGVPGTSFDWTVKATPNGIAYMSYDGPYLFDGTRAQPLAFDEIAPLFRGESVENLNPIVPANLPPTRFEWVNNELFLVDPGGQTLALNLKQLTWRDIGLALNAIYKETDSQFVLASFNGKVYQLESYANGTATLQDGATPISIEWEVGGALTDIAHYGTIQRVYVDMNTQNETVTVQLVGDGFVVTLGTVVTPIRQLVEFNVPSSWQTRVFAVRFTGNVSQRIELFTLAVDVKLEGANSELGVG